VTRAIPHLAQWSPNGAALALPVEAGDPNGYEVALYDVDRGDVTPIPGTATVMSVPMAWTSRGLFVGLNRPGSELLLAVSQPIGARPAGLRTCAARENLPPCPGGDLSMLPAEEARWPFPRSG